VTTRAGATAPARALPAADRGGGATRMAGLGARDRVAIRAAAR
jgi:hypothetical protein